MTVTPIRRNLNIVKHLPSPAQERAVGGLGFVVQDDD